MCSTSVFTIAITMGFNITMIFIINVFILKLSFANVAEFYLFLRFLLFLC